ncbi:reverse transcriptase domain-containing protein [Tanacetum coccineum]
MEPKMKLVAVLNRRISWLNKVVQEDGIRVPHLQLCGKLSSEDELKKVMTEEYCPRNELQKMETELWNLSVKGTDIIGYTRRFQELALLYPSMVTPKYKKFERYIWGLTEDIQGKVTASKPTKIQEAICMAHVLMDQVVRAKVAKDVDNKRKWEYEQG